MQSIDAILDIYQKRGSKGLPLERVYDRLFDPEIYLRAYGKIYRNDGAMTKGLTKETVDGMDLAKIHNIIGLLKSREWKWKPVRRVEIPKSNGKKRPLGIPTWSDKLLQEAMRMLLEAYYERRFSDHSHGFRPLQSCHTALREIRELWTGTVWFIEGDIKGCFDNIDHQVLLEIISRDIHDNRMLRLIGGLLRAGYVEDWKWHATASGTPQGGIISPLLSNIYLNELDRFIEDTLIPMYSRGNKRKFDPEYMRISMRLYRARKQGNLEAARRLKREQQGRSSMLRMDPDYRRLKFVRYADDFLLGFIGPKNEAEEIRQRLGEFLREHLKLELSAEKTLITHAGTEKAKFLGHELQVIKADDLISEMGKRDTNGKVSLLTPQEVTRKYRSRYSAKGRITHKTELTPETDYTIVSRYQAVLRGLYNFYCMTANVSKRITRVKRILEISLTKTLASKHQCSVARIYRKHQVKDQDGKRLQVVHLRPNKPPLVATFGGFPIVRKPEGLGTGEFLPDWTWCWASNRRSEVVQRLKFGKCELCDAEDRPVAVHHIRKLADLIKAGRRPPERWKQVMSARKRKTLVVCDECHKAIHAGKYDGSSPRELPESRMR